jgi:hypothetical protein
MVLATAAACLTATTSRATGKRARTRYRNTQGGRVRPRDRTKEVRKEISRVSSSERVGEPSAVQVRAAL